MTTPLVSFNHLSVSFAGERSRVRAVQEVSFTIQAGQTVGVVGESGCGKSVTAMALMGLLPPQTARIDGGEIRFADRDLLRLKARQMADLRGHQLAMIFQEPMSALNPVLTIGEQLCEPPIRHLSATPKAAWHQAIQLLSEVGLACGDSLMTRYPHQLSGGMLQRVMIAMALSCRPRMQLVFQDPYSSLNPRLRIGDAIGEAMLQHKLCARNELYDRVIDVMKICGLAPEHYARFPHQFSGGQRQRIGIARALILNPDFIVADEPISALDVSIQAQIINLFSDLRDNRGVTFLFISHDLGVVEHLCDDVAVMYLGQLVESASRDALFSRPLHPYTRALMAAVPTLDPHSEPQALVQGEIPDPANPPAGCRFSSRCPLASERCRREPPALREVAPGHRVACHWVAS